MADESKIKIDLPIEINPILGKIGSLDLGDIKKGLEANMYGQLMTIQADLNQKLTSRIHEKRNVRYGIANKFEEVVKAPVKNPRSDSDKLVQKQWTSLTGRYALGSESFSKRLGGDDPIAVHARKLLNQARQMRAGNMTSSGKANFLAGLDQMVTMSANLEGSPKYKNMANRRAKLIRERGRAAAEYGESTSSWEWIQAKAAKAYTPRDTSAMKKVAQQTVQAHSDALTDAFKSVATGGGTKALMRQAEVDSWVKQAKAGLSNKVLPNFGPGAASPGGPGGPPPNGPRGPGGNNIFPNGNFGGSNFYEAVFNGAKLTNNNFNQSKIFGGTSGTSTGGVAGAAKLGTPQERAIAADYLKNRRHATSLSSKISNLYQSRAIGKAEEEAAIKKHATEMAAKMAEAAKAAAVANATKESANAMAYLYLQAFNKTAKLGFGKIMSNLVDESATKAKTLAPSIAAQMKSVSFGTAFKGIGSGLSSAFTGLKANIAAVATGPGGLSALTGLLRGLGGPVGLAAVSALTVGFKALGFVVGAIWMGVKKLASVVWKDLKESWSGVLEITHENAAAAYAMASSFGTIEDRFKIIEELGRSLSGKTMLMPKEIFEVAKQFNAVGVSLKELPGYAYKLADLVHLTHGNAVQINGDITEMASLFGLTANGVDRLVEKLTSVVAVTGATSAEIMDLVGWLSPAMANIFNKEAASEWGMGIAGELNKIGYSNKIQARAAAQLIGQFTQPSADLVQALSQVGVSIWKLRGAGVQFDESLRASAKDAETLKATLAGLQKQRILGDTSKSTKEEISRIQQILSDSKASLTEDLNNLINTGDVTFDIEEFNTALVELGKKGPEAINRVSRAIQTPNAKQALATLIRAAENYKVSLDEINRAGGISKFNEQTRRDLRKHADVLKSEAQAAKAGFFQIMMGQIITPVQQAWYGMWKNFYTGLTSADALKGMIVNVEKIVEPFKEILAGIGTGAGEFLSGLAGGDAALQNKGAEKLFSSIDELGVALKPLFDQIGVRLGVAFDGAVKILGNSDGWKSIGALVSQLFVNAASAIISSGVIQQIGKIIADTLAGAIVGAVQAGIKALANPWNILKQAPLMQAANAAASFSPKTSYSRYQGWGDSSYRVGERQAEIMRIDTQAEEYEQKAAMDDLSQALAFQYANTAKFFRATAAKLREADRELQRIDPITP